MARFDQDIKKRLGLYKQNNFPDLADGKYNSKGKIVKHPHILPKKEKELNILENYREEFWMYEKDCRDKKKKISIHPDFQHLNSSQAMCFNFFYPLLHEDNLRLITDFLGLEQEEIENAEFEKDSLVDGAGRHTPTSFDFYIKTKSGKEIYFEIKYTERGFSGFKLNKSKQKEKYEEKYIQVYEEPLKKVISGKYIGKEMFFIHYQILRNLIHVDKNSYVVFLYPKQNTKVKSGADLAEREMLQKFKSHFFNLTWDELYNNIYPKLKSSNKLENTFNEFSRKYL